MAMILPDMVAAVYCIVASLGGLLANCTLIILIATDKELRRKEFVYFIFNRTFSDLAFCIFLGTLNPIAILTTEMDSNACVAAGFFVITFGFASIYSEPLLALNRYISVLKSHKYDRIYTRRNIILMCALTWTLAMMTSIVDLLNDSLGRSIGFYCCLKFSVNHLALIMTMNYPLIFCGLACIIVCNYKMFIYLRRYQAQPMTNNQMTQLQSDREMLRFIFATAFVPFVLECPIGVIAIVGMIRPVSSWYMFAGLALHLTSFTINPIITVLMVRSIRKQFFKLFGKVLPGQCNSTVDVERIG